jgi:hypothetical protein
MAEMTGLSEAEVRKQYAAAVAAAQAAGVSDTNPAFSSVNFLHGDHWGSRRQLMFGMVVGDHLGIHPVFATFLNPCGGLIGPGGGALTTYLDTNLSGINSDNVWDYHGAAHDAYGYLYNNHDIGPGYQYIDSEINNWDPNGTDDSLSGQVSGYIYWARKMGASEAAIEMLIRRLTPPYVKILPRDGLDIF